MPLTPSERARFQGWLLDVAVRLDREADGMVRAGIAPVLVGHKRSEAAAARIVARTLYNMPPAAGAAAEPVDEASPAVTAARGVS